MMMSNSPAKVTTLRERAYDSFTERLLSQEIRPGQFVSQRVLMQITGMPLGAIREMIPRLEADGLIKTVPKCGLQILNLDVSLIRDAFQLRQILEREALLHFCRTAENDLIQQMLEEHKNILGLDPNRITQDQLEQAQSVDWSFHDTMIDALSNALISNAYRVNSIKIRLIGQDNTRMSPEQLPTAIAEHLAILDALVDRDENAAADALEKHIDNARRRALQL